MCTLQVTFGLCPHRVCSELELRVVFVVSKLMLNFMVYLHGVRTRMLVSEMLCAWVHKEVNFMAVSAV